MGDSNIKVPFEPVENFYEYLQTELKLSANKAFKVIYYLQEHFEWEDESGKHYGIIPDTYEKCRARGCDTLYDSNYDGCSALRCDEHACSNGDCDSCRKTK